MHLENIENISPDRSEKMQIYASFQSKKENLTRVVQQPLNSCENTIFKYNSKFKISLDG